MHRRAVLTLALLAPAAAATRARAREAHWPSTLVIGTASPGGTYYAYGEALARILTRELGLAVSMRPTEGPAENIRLLEANEIQLAFVTQGVALQAWNGTGAFAGKPMRTMRVMFPMYDTPFQFMVPADAPAQAVTDLAGKRVGIGPQGGTGGAYVPEIFKALKVEAPLVTGEWADLANQIVDKKIDALAVAAGVPFPSFGDIERKLKVRYLPLTSRQIVDLRLAMPELGAASVPSGSYPSLRRLYPTVGLYNFAVAREDLPDDLVAELVGAVFGRIDELIDGHPAAAETSPSNIARNSFLPFHGGAARWYRNSGASGIVRGD